MKSLVHFFQWKQFINEPSKFPSPDVWIDISPTGRKKEEELYHEIVPHLLLFAPAGAGKGTFIECMTEIEEVLYPVLQILSTIRFRIR